MSRLHALVLLVLVGVTLQPFAGLDCSPRGTEPLPCCVELRTACHQVGDAAACCRDAPASSDSGTAVTARPPSRPDDPLVMVAAPAAVLASPDFAVGFAERARATVESPPRAPAVLRL